jgi:hypothetical protein
MTEQPSQPTGAWEEGRDVEVAFDLLLKLADTVGDELYSRGEKDMQLVLAAFAMVRAEDSGRVLVGDEAGAHLADMLERVCENHPGGIIPVEKLLEIAANVRLECGGWRGEDWSFARAEGAAAERGRLSVLMPCGHPVSDWQPDQASCGACNETADLLGKVWHAIETAPKDGSRVLVCLPRCGNLILRASYDAVHGYWKTDQDSEGITRPTFFHPGDCWMLMPTPPARPASPPTSGEGEAT